MALVDDDDRADEAQDVAKALFQGNTMCPESLVRHIVHVEVQDFIGELAIANGIVHIGKERRELPAVLEHLQLFLGLSRRSLEHQQHDAQVLVHVVPGEGIAPLQQLHAPAGRAFQHLAVRMLAVGESLPRLRVDGVGRDHPEHEAGLALEVLDVQLLHRSAAEQRLAAAGRDLQADVGDGAFEAIQPAEVRRCDQLARGILGAGQRGVSGQRLPGVAAVVGRRGVAALGLLEGDEFLRLVPLGG